MSQSCMGAGILPSRARRLAVRGEAGSRALLRTEVRAPAPSMTEGVAVADSPVGVGRAGRRLRGALVLVQGDAGVAEIAQGIDEGDELGGVLFKGSAGVTLAVFDDGFEVLQQRDLGAGLAELCGAADLVLTDEIEDALGLKTGAFVDGLGVEVIFVAAQAPVADVVFVEVAAGGPEFLDDFLVGQAIVEHAIYLVAEFGRHTSDLAVTTGF